MENQTVKYRIQELTRKYKRFVLISITIQRDPKYQR